MCRLIGFALFFIAIGMIISCIMEEGFFFFFLIVALLVLAYCLFCKK